MKTWFLTWNHSKNLGLAAFRDYSGRSKGLYLSEAFPHVSYLPYDHARENLFQRSLFQYRF